MKRFQKCLCYFFAICLLSFFSLYADAATRTLKGGTVVPSTHPYVAALQIFSDIVYSRTGGAIRFEVHSGGELGGETEMPESVKLGILDWSYGSAASVGKILQAPLGVFVAPYIWRDYSHIQ